MITRSKTLAMLVGLAAAAAPALRAADDPEAARFREALVARIEASASNISSALRQYNQMELAGKWDLFARHEIHEALLAALRKVADPTIARVAANAIRHGGRSQLPMQILLMKALIGERFPMPVEERVALLVEAAEDRSFRLSIWGLRLLGDSRWRESVDALIELLREAEQRKRADELLGNVAAAELYRVLGSSAPRGATAGEIRGNWEKLGKKLPEEPDYTPVRSSGRTISFFGDMISPRSAFVIDISGSMRQETVLVIDSDDPGKTTVGKGGERTEGPRRPKVELVKKELERSLSRLLPHYEFNVLGYNSKFYPWRAGEPMRLHRAEPRSLESAIEFARALEVASGTNIHDSLIAALEIPEVETVYLLSDGVPSVGGKPPEIERRLAAMNYLLGVRVITYGFAAEAQGTYDEAFMKRLASLSWGWYRRLNRR